MCARLMSPSAEESVEALARVPVGPAERGPAERGLGTRVWAGVWWLVKFVAALFLFIGSLQVMKLGAGGIGRLLDSRNLMGNPLSTFGLGWIGALLVLSGSPIAASSLTLVAGGTLSETEGFAMAVGSRVGAAFVVLLVAVLYALRGGDGKRYAPLSTAVIALSTTALIYLPGGLLGLGILGWRPFQQLHLQFPRQVGDALDLIYGDLLRLIQDLPALVLFLGGLGILLVSFKLIDDVVPEFTDKTIEGSLVTWLRRKWPMFALGCLVALVTMSVSVALTVLVPLVAKKYVRKDQIIPYIAGANITTLGDTLLAAFLLQSDSSVRIVLAMVLGASVVTVVALGLFYRHLHSLIFAFQRWIIQSRPRLAGFTAGLFLVPLVIVMLSAGLS